MEEPLGEKDLGPYIVSVYTPEQQQRLGVNEFGKMIAAVQQDDFGHYEGAATLEMATDEFLAAESAVASTAGKGAWPTTSEQDVEYPLATHGAGSMYEVDQPTTMYDMGQTTAPEEEKEPAVTYEPEHVLAVQRIADRIDQLDTEVPTWPSIQEVSEMMATAVCVRVCACVCVCELSQMSIYLSRTHSRNLFPCNSH